MAFEHLTAHDRSIDVALRVDAEAFGTRMIGRGRFHILDEGGDFPIPGAADADAFLDAHELMRAAVGSRFGIGDVNGVVLGDEDAARAAELTPGIEQFALLVEDLDAVVLAIANE